MPKELNACLANKVVAQVKIKQLRSMSELSDQLRVSLHELGVDLVLTQVKRLTPSRFLGLLISLLEQLVGQLEVPDL